MRASLLIAVTDRHIRSSLAALLETVREPELSLHLLTDPYTFVDTARSLRPDLIIVSADICSAPLIDTVRTAASLTETHFVLYCDTIAGELMAERADGHISLEVSDQEILDLVTSLLRVEQKREEEELLTPREREIVIGIVKGMTNKEIADKLFISPNTVTTHRRNIVKKLDIHSASGLTVYAIMNKLVSLKDIHV